VINAGFFNPPPGVRIAIIGTREPEDRLITSVVNYVLDLHRARGTASLTIVSGGADGVDSIAVGTARAHGIPFVEHLPAKYLPAQKPLNGYPKELVIAALMRRNGDIVADCDALVAFPGRGSRGTWDAVRKAIKAERLWEVRRG
jgi:predicted Rossmann-fold nucleotide-binding protein